MLTRRQGLAAILLLSITALTVPVHAADKDMNADPNDLALHGYDPVAYFTPGQPVKGKPQFTATYKNAIYRFASAGHRDTFRANPGKYAPQFGGYCAMGVVFNKKLDVDPQAWRIVDDKLYLNVNRDVQKKWVDDIPGNLKTAYANWPSIQDKPAAELNQ